MLKISMMKGCITFFMTSKTQPIIEMTSWGRKNIKKHDQNIVKGTAKT